MAQRPHIALLHCVFRIGWVPQQITGQRIDRVEMRQRDVAKPPRPCRILVRCLIRHNVSFSFPRLRRLALRKTRHGTPLPPPAPSTAIDRVEYGRGEQKGASALAVAGAKESLPSDALMVEAACGMSSGSELTASLPE